MSQIEAATAVTVVYVALGILLAPWLADRSIEVKGLDRYPPEIMAMLRVELALWSIPTWPLMVWELRDCLVRDLKRALRRWGLWP